MPDRISQPLTFIGALGLFAVTAGVWPVPVQAHDWSWQQDHTWSRDARPARQNDRPIWGWLVEPGHVLPRGINQRGDRAYFVPQRRLPDGTLYPTDQYLRGQTNHPSVASPNH